MADARFARRLPERPLSPHLQIYRFTWTMAMSIAHRVSGAAAYFAAPLLVLWLLAAAQGPEAYATLSAIYGSWFGIIVLIGVSWAVIHHTIGGVRHMVWDTTIGMDKKSRTLWAQGTLAGSVVLTVLVWLAILIWS
jgi:succinate dehydrogenase / fumarate reductase, cytochrome b subunit